MVACHQGSSGPRPARRSRRSSCRPPSPARRASDPRARPPARPDGPSPPPGRAPHGLMRRATARSPSRRTERRLAAARSLDISSVPTPNSNAARTPAPPATRARFRGIGAPNAATHSATNGNRNSVAVEISDVAASAPPRCRVDPRDRPHLHRDARAHRGAPRNRSAHGVRGQLRGPRGEPAEARERHAVQAPRTHERHAARPEHGHEPAHPSTRSSGTCAQTSKICGASPYSAAAPTASSAMRPTHCRTVRERPDAPSRSTGHDESLPPHPR